MALSTSKLKELRRRPVGESGNRLSDALDLSDQTATAVAEALGFTLPYLSDVRSGRYNTITVENAHKFARYFGCAIEDLFPSREAVA